MKFFIVLLGLSLSCTCSAQSDLLDGSTPVNISSIKSPLPLIQSTNISTSTPSIFDEDPPDDFGVSARYKPNAGPIPRDNALVALVWCIGAAAQRPFNEVTPNFRCCQKSPIEVRMVPNRQTTMRAKHVVWSLATLLDFWIEGNARLEIAETTWVTSSLERGVLCFGAFSTTERSGGNGGGGEGVGLSDEAEYAISSNNGTMPSMDSDLAPVGVSPITLLINPYNTFTPLTSIGTFYSLLIQGLLRLAEVPSTEGIEDLQSIYDAEADLTLSWGPTSARAGQQGLFVAGFAVEAILRIAEYMVTRKPSEQFYAFSATIQTQRGRYVGRLGFWKGKMEPSFRPTVLDAGAEAVNVTEITSC